jgi:hypothetical protein
VSVIRPKTSASRRNFGTEIVILVVGAITYIPDRLLSSKIPPEMVLSLYWWSFQRAFPDRRI